MKTFTASNLPDRETLRQIILDDGCLVVTGVLSPDYIAHAKPALEAAIKKETEYHGTTDYKDYGMVLVCSLYGSTFYEPFDNDVLMAPFNAVLGDGCIVYAYTSSSMPPNKTNYSRRIHRDCPTTRMAPGFPTNMGATITLDDFTLDNGASYFMPRSHTRVDTPSEDAFAKGAERFVAPAGSVMFFDALTFHAGGDNKTDRWRHALTINMGRSWMKQRIDIPRAMTSANIDVASISKKAKQKLGFFTQVPASYDEYYAPPEKRKYTQPVE
jgi:ectoine hydroxylase-related dioxygenase (phytanoyl-CoA dioxygenase family)